MMDMVKGLERFREYFAGHESSYALIGGVACHILFSDAGLEFRATKDFDLVLCVEVVSKEFGGVFAKFLEAGGYQARERSTGHREFYRFHRPADDSFPEMIELFARRPDTPLLPDGAELSPIPVEEDVISLSAILLDDDCFEALLNMRTIVGDVCLIDEKVLIPFKARAFLDLSRRKANGEDIDTRQVRKHRADVFRLVQLLPGSGDIVLGNTMRNDLAEFLEQAKSDTNFQNSFGSLKLPFSMTVAAQTLKRYYRLEESA